MKLQCKTECIFFDGTQLFENKIYDITKTEIGYRVNDSDNLANYNKHRFTISKTSLDNYFYTLAETRKLKLEKLYDI